MNRIYKVIWSKVKNCYVVVSEIAKRNSKSTVDSGFSVTRNILAGAVVLGLTAGVCAPVWAADGKVGMYNFIGDKIYIDNSTATGERAAAFGYGTHAEGVKSFATGHNTYAYGEFSSTFGYETKAKGNDAMASGFQTIAVGPGATTWGYQSIVGQIANGYTVNYENPDLTKITAVENATAWGAQTNAAAMDATAWGYQSKATGTTSTAFGIGTLASGNQSTAFGNLTIASGQEATAFGLYTEASGLHSLAAGEGTATDHTVADGEDAVALGMQVKALGNHSIAVGRETKTYKDAQESVAMGYKSEAKQNYAFAAGNHSIADGIGAVAMGYDSTATGEAAFAVGRGANATMKGAVALGSYSVADAANNGTGGYAISGKAPGSDTPGNAGNIGQDYVWKPAGGYGNVAVGDVSGNTKITRRITGLAAGYDLTDAVNVAQLYDLRDEITSSSSDWQLADAAGVVDGKTKTPYTVKIVDGKPQVTLKVVNNKVENPAANAQEYVIDLSELPDKDTKYSGTQTVTVATNTSNGSTTFNLMEKGEDTPVPVGSMIIKAGQNVKITQEGGEGETPVTAVISAETDLSGVQLKFAGDDYKKEGETESNVVTRTNEEKLDILGGATELTDNNIGVVNEGSENSLKVKLAKDIALPDGSITITPKEGDSYTDIVIKQGDVRMGDNYITNVKNAGDKVNNDYTSTTINNYGATISDVKNIAKWDAYIGSSAEGGSGTHVGAVDVNNPYFTLQAGDNVTIEKGTETNSVKISADMPEIPETSLKFAGDDYKKEGETESNVVTRTNEEKLDILGGATELTDNNIGVVNEGSENSLKVKLAKDIALPDGSITITPKEGDSYTDIVIKQGDVRMGDNYITNVKNAGDKVNNDYTSTTINNYGATISDVKNIAKWDAYIGSSAEGGSGTHVGAVDVNNPYFTLQAGDNVTIEKGTETNSVKISADMPEIPETSLKFAGDDYKKEGETESNVVTRTNEEKLDILGGATELTDNNIGVVNEGSENSLKVKLAKDIALPDGSITITPKEGDSYTDIVIKQGDVRMGDNYITNVKNAGDKVNNDYTSTTINNYGATISDVKNIAKWDAYIGSSAEGGSGTHVGAVDVNNPYFTLQAGDNVTIEKGTETNSVKISADMPEIPETSLKFAGDDYKKEGETESNVVTRTNEEKLDILGGATELTDNNIGVVNEGSENSLKVKLAKDIALPDGSITITPKEGDSYTDIVIKQGDVRMGDNYITNVKNAGDKVNNDYTSTTINNYGATISDVKNIAKWDAYIGSSAEGGSGTHVGAVDVNNPYFTLQAGDNVTIEKGTETNSVKISADMPEIPETSLKFAGDDYKKEGETESNVVTRTNEEKLDILGGATELTDNNIGVVNEGSENSLKVKLAKDIALPDGSITITPKEGDSYTDIVIKQGDVRMGDNYITNVKNAGDKVNNDYTSTTINNYGATISDVKNIAKWDAYIGSSAEGGSGTHVGAVDVNNPYFTLQAGDNVTIEKGTETNSVKISADMPEIPETSLKFAGDDYKKEGETESNVVTRTNEEKLDILGGATELTDNNIGVVNEGSENSLKVKLAKDIALPDGSITITPKEGDSYTDIVIKQGDVRMGDNYITNVKNAGDKVNNDYTSTTINNYGATISDVKNIAKWDAYIGSSAEGGSGTHVGAVDVNNPYFTLQAGDNVTIEKGTETNSVKISADMPEIPETSLKFAGDDYKKEGETESNVVTRTNEEKLDILGGATELTDNNIGVVNEGSENSLKVKLAKDIALPDGSITITPKEGDSYTDIVIKQGDVRMGDNYITNVKNAGDKVNNDYTSTTINNYGATISDVKNIAKWDAYIGSSAEGGSGTHVGAVDVNNPYFTLQAGDNVTIEKGTETNSVKISADMPEIPETSLKFAGDDYKKEGETESNVVTRTNEEKLDILGGATELTDNNIGVVNEGSENSLKVKLAKDIALPDGSITITPKEGDSYTDIVIKQGDVRMGDNYITNVKNAGDKVNNDYTKTEINNYGATISDVKNIAKWDAYIKSSGETGTAVGTVDINNPYFTLQAGDNVTIVKGDETNSVKISSASFEAGDGITISKDETTNKYKISLNIEGGVTPTDKVTVEPKSSTGSETAGGETTTPGTTGGEAAGSGTSGSTEAGKAVTITSDTNSTAFTDDAGTTFVTVTPTSKDDETSAKNNLQIKGDGTNITTVATSNGQDKGGSIQVKLNSDITVDNVTVNNTVKAKTINATTIAGDTINATTVNGDTVNTQTIKLGDTTIKQGDDNRITYNTKSGDTYNIATLEDGMDFAGDDGKTIHKNLADQLDIVGGAAEKASKDNIYTYNDNGKIHINLAKDIEGVDTVTVNKTINVGGNTTITGDTITTKTVNVGDTTINNNGVTIKNGPSITKNGVDAGGKKITNVAPGTDGTDAVNVDQLNSAMNQTGGAINRLGDQISKVDNRMKKGLAGAAALAALHPLEFDPDDKLTFAAGLGNYRGENAAAIGAFYRPDEKVMFSVGGTVGNGENMVNAGISFSLDRVPHVTNTKAAMAREILDLRREVLELKASMASGNWMLDPTLTRLFPDTEENHWAYEYVKTLAGNHIIEGYPDGEFKGDQMITRYEMAAILYRAMMNGAKLPDKALNEFADELGRFRVDRIYGNGDDRHKVERIRVNDENRNDRDVYGSRYEYFNQHPGANVSTGALPGTKQAERAAKAEAAAKQNEKPSVVSHSEKAAG